MIDYDYEDYEKGTVQRAKIVSLLGQYIPTLRDQDFCDIKCHFSNFYNCIKPYEFGTWIEHGSLIYVAHRDAPSNWYWKHGSYPSAPSSLSSSEVWGHKCSRGFFDSTTLNRKWLVVHLQQLRLMATEDDARRPTSDVVLLASSSDDDVDVDSRVYCARGFLSHIPYFEPLFSGRWSASSVSEGGATVVDLSSHDFATPTALRRLILYLYSGRLENTASSSSEVSYSDKGLNDDLNVIQLADYLQYPMFLHALSELVFDRMNCVSVSGTESFYHFAGDTILRLVQLGNIASQSKLLECAKPIVKARASELMRLIVDQGQHETELFDHMLQLIAER